MDNLSSIKINGVKKLGGNKTKEVQHYLNLKYITVSPI